MRITRKYLTAIAFFVALLVPLTGFTNTFQNIGKSADDTLITSKVKLSLAQCCVSPSRKVSVTTKSGVVYLSGVLDTQKQFESVYKHTKAVKGVQDINIQNLMVKSSPYPASDAAITLQVKAKILKEQFFKSRDYRNWPVQVTTKNAIVHLSGKVSDVKTKRRLLRSIKKIDNVTSINDDALRVG